MSKRLLKYPISFKIVRKEKKKRHDDALRNSKRLPRSCQGLQMLCLVPTVPCAVLSVAGPQAQEVELGKVSPCLENY